VVTVFAVGRFHDSVCQSLWSTYYLFYGQLFKSTDYHRYRWLRPCRMDHGYRRLWSGGIDHGYVWLRPDQMIYSGLRLPITYVRAIWSQPPLPVIRVTWSQPPIPMVFSWYGEGPSKDDKLTINTHIFTVSSIGQNLTRKPF